MKTNTPIGVALRYFTFFLFFFSFNISQSNLNAQECTTTDSLALVELYNSSTGLPWNLTQQMSTWQGITVDANGCVIRIQLDAVLTSGTIPYQLGDIENLLELDLEDCNLTGSIPSSLSNLTNLVELDLEGNNLTGSIPTSLASLPNLNELVLIDNDLSGCFMPQLQGLCSISTANNQISDGNNFDGSWFDFCNAQANECTSCREQDSITLLTIFSNFDLFTVTLTGPMDTWPGITLNENGCVKGIYYDECCIYGGILAPEIGNLSSLETLNLSEAGLYGTIPDEMANLQQLKYLNLGESLFTGSIPTWLGDFSDLIYLNLCQNLLSGEIPGELGDLSNLVTLLLFGNDLSGNIPGELGNLNNINLLDATWNNLSGCFDSNLSNLCPINSMQEPFANNNMDATWQEFCNLGSGTCSCRELDSLTLITVYSAFNGIPFDPNQPSVSFDVNQPIDTWQGIILNANGCVSEIQLSDDISGSAGTIAPEIGDLSELEILQLSENRLAGTIPPEISNLSNLKILNLSENSLTGGIPASLSNLTNLTFLYLSDNQLDGCYDPQLTTLCNIPNTSISFQNNFDAEWEDFCITGIGACNPHTQTCRQSDSLALVALYNATDGPNWTTTWDLTQPIDTWHGVTLNQDGCVFLLFLPSNGLTGPIPAELADLISLRELGLEDNNLTGNIPGELGDLTNLADANFTNNNLSGCYDANLAHWCYSLTVQIDIGNNFDTSWWGDFCATGAGTCAPSESCRQSDSLTLVTFYNNINGLIWDLAQPINTWQGITLNANGCVSAIQLSDDIGNGTIAPEIGNLSELEHLSLSENRLTGIIPPEIGNLTNLKSLDLAENNLTGGIPASLSNLTNLNLLYLSDNFLEGCYDPQLIALCNIPYTSISFQNNFDGGWDNFCDSGLGACEIQQSCRQRDSLILANFYNSLTGVGGQGWDLNQPIDSWFGLTLNAEGCVTVFDINDQGWSGTIPSELGDLSELTYLNFDENNFSGSIPSSFGDLSNLTHLDLSTNNLSGVIPPQLGQLTNLEHLNLNANSFSGDIPVELGNLTNLNLLDFGTNDLTGPIPNSLGNLPLLTWVRLSGNMLTGCFGIPLQNWCTQLSTAFIDDGGAFNNFDASWQDFCATGAGTCDDCRSQDSLTLLTVFSNLINPIDVSGPMETWQGIVLNSQGCVTELNFDDCCHNGGTIAPEIGNLSSLEKLYLTERGLTGTIPPEIGNLTNLVELALWQNNLTGNLPKELANLTNLTKIDIGVNQLSGCYDQDLIALCDVPSRYISGSNNFDASFDDFCNLGLGACTNCANIDSLALIELYNVATGLNWDLQQPFSTWQGITVNGNGCVIRIQLDGVLTGGIIPPALASIEYLLELDLEDCNLTGSIPSTLGNLQNLVELDLEGNNLTGSIPVSLASLPNLGELVLIENQLSGCYDAQLLPLCNISNANNQISDSNNFEGPWFDFCTTQAFECSCRYLDSLSLIAVYSSLGGVYFDVNQPIDTWQGVTLNANGCVVAINLDDDINGGTIAPEIGNFSELEILNLNENRISGTIPSEIGNLGNLQRLDLDENNLVGPIPTEIGNLNQLTRLNLRDNMLSGDIPSEIGDLTDLQTLAIDNNQFTGGIPISFASLSNLINLAVSSNLLEGCYDTELSILCNIPNTSISFENNFDADWTDFCASGMGACQSLQSCRLNDSLALVTFHNSVGNFVQFNWDFNQPMDTWYGVVLNPTGCVTGLYLSDSDLAGSIPPEIGDLSYLTHLDLSSNFLSGNIPQEIGALHNLTHLDLSLNSLNGSIPEQLGELNNLTHLDLYFNSLISTIPADFMNLNKLTFLNLSENSIIGTIPLDIGALNNLVTLSLSGNHLSGLIPSSIGNLTQLESLWLSDNNLNGSIPAEFWNLTNLQNLSLAFNNLSGSLPVELGNLSLLINLELHENGLSGNLPGEFGNLSNLAYTDISANNFAGCFDANLTNLCGQLDPLSKISDGNNFDASWQAFCDLDAGNCSTHCPGDSLALVAIYNSISGFNWNLSQPISSWEGITVNANGCVTEFKYDDRNLNGDLPPEIGDLSNLSILILDENEITGSVPPEIGNLTHLIELDLEQNNMSGPIPTEIGNLTNLITLELEGMDGTIPPEIGNLINLEFLDLGKSNLTGPIPPEFGNLINVTNLNLGINNLSGPIPAEIANMTSLFALILHDNNLTGSIPAEFANLQNLSFIELFNNNLSGCYDPILSNLCAQLSPNFNWEFFINTGNNFDELFEDFCNSGAGACSVGCSDQNALNYTENASPLGSCIYEFFTCYAVSEMSAESNILYSLNNQTSNWMSSGLTGTSVLEAIAFDQSTALLYGTDGGIFGRINTSTGQFMQINNVGTGNGELGAIELTDIDGLTYDPLTNVMYGTQRRSPHNLLFAIDIATGTVIQNAMIDSNGNPADYALIKEVLDSDIGEYAFVVDDIAINPQTGELFVIQNIANSGVVSIIDKSDASLQQVVFDVSIGDIEGLAFDHNNNLVATTGRIGSPMPNSFYKLDYFNQIEMLVGPIDQSNTIQDFESIDCFQMYTLQCPDELIISNPISIDQNRSANININSTSHIQNGSTRFSAGQYLELQPNFEVSIQSVFVAEIEGCN